MTDQNAEAPSRLSSVKTAKARPTLSLPPHPPIESVPQTKSFNGDFLLYRKVGANLKRRCTGDPRFRHKTMASAEAEAGRLLGIYSESTFVILQEVGRVKLKAVKND